MKRAIGVVLQVSLLVGLTTMAIGAAPAGAITLPSCSGSTLAGNDDGSTSAVPLAFNLNFFGHTYSSLYVNNNGNVTFNSSLSTFTPNAIGTGLGFPIIAPFWADVDTRPSGSAKVTYGTTTFNGHQAFCASWGPPAGGSPAGVGYYDEKTNKLNAFELILVDRSDQHAGDFDIVFDYQHVLWETGDASGGSNGLGGNSARAGYSDGQAHGTSFELAGSAVDGGLLDSNATTGLINHSNAGVDGQYLYAVRNGLTASHVSIETAANGTGTHLNAQNVASGSSVTAYAIARDASNAFVANVAGTWSLTNKTGGVVDADLVPAGDGKSATFTGLSTGSAKIHVVNGSFTDDSGTLTVTPGALASIVVTPSDSTITAGGSQDYTAEGFDSHGNSRGDVTSSTTFSISPDGSCTGASCTTTVSGDHTVTGTDGAFSDDASLHVNPGDLASIVVTPDGSTITAGDSQDFTAQGFDSHGNSLGDVTGDTTFSISPDGSCTGASCTATVAGDHTVRGNDSGFHDDVTLHVNPGDLASIVVTPDGSSITAGGSKSFTAEGFDSYSNSLGDVTGDTTFSISPDGSCTNASCTTTVAGDHTVEGNDAGFTNDVTLHVNPGPLHSIVVTPDGNTITAGGSQDYTAEGFDSHGNSRGDVTGDTTFSISPNGSCTGATCTANIAGDHTVTGTDGAFSDDVTLHVHTGPLHSIVVSPDGNSITAGGSQDFTAQGFDSHGNSLGDVTSSTTFSISPDGSCTGASCATTASGDHTVTGTDSGFQDDVTLHVNPGDLASIVVTPDDSSITAGGSKSFTAEGFDSYGNSRGDVTSSTTFSISPDGSCTGASCTTTVAGDHTVEGNDAGFTNDVTLHVNPGALASIVISPSDSTITAGGSQDYTAEGFDSHGNSRGDVTSSTTFSISPDGSCTGASCTTTVSGDHTVTGTDGAFSDDASLHVNPGDLASIVVTPDGSTITAGDSQDFTAQGFDSHGNSLGDVTGDTTFSISPDGSCTGASCTATVAGDHTVRGNDSGFHDDVTLHVNPGDLASIVVTPDGSSITAGGSKSFTAEGFDSYSNSLGDVTGDTTFSISPDGSCTNASCTTTVAGDHTVEGNDAGFTNDVTLHVNPGPLHSIVVTPDGNTITAGGSQDYTAEGFDSHGNSRGDVTGDTTFSISPNGSCTGATCTANIAGDHTVTGTDGAFSDHVTLHVNAVIVPPTLTLTKSDSPDPVDEQNPITYSMQASNTGTQSATGVVLTDTIPAGTTFNQATTTQGSCAFASGTLTCNLGALAGGGTATVTLIVQAPDVTADTTITNHASVTASNAATTNASADTDVLVNQGGSTEGQVPPDTTVPLTFTTTTQSNGGTPAVSSGDPTGVSIIVPPGGPGGSILLQELPCQVAPCTGAAAAKDVGAQAAAPATGKLVLGGIVYNVVPPSGYTNKQLFKVTMLYDKTLGAKLSPVFYFKPGVTPTEIKLPHCGTTPPNSGKPCVLTNAKILTGPPLIRGDWKVVVRINSDPRMRK